jgi:succinate-semialdehyde dehydrogenase / glutarate-semialdehyde dehydrogenase
VRRCMPFSGLLVITPPIFTILLLSVVLVKGARNVPQCSLTFARVFEDAGSPDGVYTNLFCSFDQLSTLIDDFRVRGVTLTGSERAGATVAANAGRALKKVVLELGGSDPFIVLSDANIEDAAFQGAEGRMLVQGQVCVSCKRFIVVGAELGERFLSNLREEFSKLKAGDPIDTPTTLGPISSESALRDILKQIDSAKAHGASIIMGDKRINRPGFYVEPTIISNISSSNPLYLQETFGPVASSYVVNDEKEAIELANATKFGLGASVFGG